MAVEGFPQMSNQNQGGQGGSRVFEGSNARNPYPAEQPIRQQVRQPGQPGQSGGYVDRNSTALAYPTRSIQERDVQRELGVGNRDERPARDTSATQKRQKQETEQDRLVSDYSWMQGARGQSLDTSLGLAGYHGTLKDPKTYHQSWYKDSKDSDSGRGGYPSPDPKTHHQSWYRDS